MSEHMKKQITKGFAEISLHVPADKKEQIKSLIENILNLTTICYSIRTESEENDETLSLEEIFPDLHTGSAIRGLRCREGLTQTALAEKLGVSRHQISEMENGRRPIGKDMAKRLAAALNTVENIFLQQQRGR